MNIRTLIGTCVLLLASGISVFGDCGKIIIINVPRPRPRPPMPIYPIIIDDVGPQLSTGWNASRPMSEITINVINQYGNNNTALLGNAKNGSKVVQNVGKNSRGQDEILLPPPMDFGREDNDMWTAPTDDGLVPPASAGRVGGMGFSEPFQQAVIAWNGKSDASGEEMLILTTNEKFLETGGAMISILPLPGIPKSITRANASVFSDAKALLTKKWDSNLVVGGLGVFMETKIGSHNIFVWKMDNIDHFAKDVKAYVENKYDGKATALITPQILEVVKGYHDRGFRYFAFDITMVDGNDFKTKEAIAYKFQSTNLYFPLVISKIGGKGSTLVDIVALTPDTLAFPDNGLTLMTPENREGQVMLNGKGTVLFEKSEVKVLDDNLAGFTQAWPQIRARNFLIRGPIDGFNKDFIMVADQ